MEIVLVLQSLLGVMIFFVFNVAESYTTKHIYFTEKSGSQTEPSCEKPSLHSDQVFTTDVKNSTLALIGSRILFTPSLNYTGCAKIKLNINPYTLGYNTNSDEEDGLHKCYSFCTNGGYEYDYVGMHERKCSCLTRNDVDAPTGCTKMDAASCGFLSSTRCSIKENIAVLYAIKVRRIHHSSDLVCDENRQLISIFLRNREAFKDNPDVWSGETHGVKILKPEERTYHKQHCCVAAYVRNNSTLMNPMVSACNVKLPQACLISRKEFDRLTYLMMLTLVACGLNMPILLSLIYQCIVKQRNVGKNIGAIHGNGNTARISSITQLRDVSMASAERMSVSPYINGGDPANNALHFMLTEAFRRFNGDFRRCSIKISFTGNEEEEETYGNHRNRVSITFDNCNNPMRYETPCSFIDGGGADQRSYTAMHTYLNDVDFQSISSNK